jgi:phosphoglycolate phosphatase
MNQMLVQHGLPPSTPEHYASIFRFPVSDYYQEIGWDFEKVPFETVSDAFIGEYERRKLECPVRADGVALIKELDERGMPQSIISAMKQDYLRDIVRRHAIFDHFVTVRGLDDHHARGKLDIGRQWMAELALPPEKVLMIGDTLHDYELAQALGIDCALVPSGHQSKERLLASGATVYDSLSEIDI